MTSTFGSWKLPDGPPSYNLFPMRNHSSYRSPWLSRAAAIALAMIVLSFTLAAQYSYQPSPENLKSREWFEQARFGMFIHWGIYSELGDGEWVMQEHHLTGPQYEQLAAQF